MRGVTRLLATCLLALLPATAPAVGLGDLEIESFLGEPFVATLTIEAEPGTRLTAIELEEGAALDYRRLGVTASGYTFSFSIGDADFVDGGFRIPVRADRRVTELFIDLVVVLRSSGMHQIRHYAVLLDPPPTTPLVRSSTPAPAITTAAPPVLEARPDQAPGAATERQAIGAQPDAGRDRWRVRPGDTLNGIAARIRGDASLEATADALLELNPEAFISGDRNRLMAGARLRLPDGAVLPSPASDEPSSSIAAAPPRSPAEARRTPVTPLVAGLADREFRRAAESDRVRLRAPPGTAEVISRLADWIDADDDALLAGSGDIQRDIAYARTEITTFRNENDNLRERIGLMEERVQKLRRLIALREEADAPASASNGAGAAASTAAPAPPATEPIVSASAPAPSAGEPPPSADSTARDPRVWWTYGVGAVVTCAVIFLAVRIRRRRPLPEDPVERRLREWADPRLLPDEL